MGRWIFALQFRRPAMSVFQSMWRFIGGSERITASLRLAIRRELLQMCMISPLLHCNLRAEVECMIAATDASETGCAIGSSQSLTDEGADYLAACRKNETGGVLALQPILIVSLFNGIGGAFRCYDILRVVPSGRSAVERDAGANHITFLEMAKHHFVTDVKQVSRKLVREWSHKYLQISEVHIWGGFPCIDLSAVKFNRQYLSGKQSSVFWEVPRITKLVKEELESQ